MARNQYECWEAQQPAAAAAAAPCNAVSSRASPASLAVWCQSSTISAHTGDVIEVATSTLCGTVEARAFLSQFPIFSARTHTTRYPPPPPPRRHLWRLLLYYTMVPHSVGSAVSSSSTVTTMCGCPPVYCCCRLRSFFIPGFLCWNTILLDHCCG